ncbi:hypothetical protein KR018_008555, partial [Drosophila ironensis]
KILIVDARSYTSAVTNRARGGGCECIEYYPCAEIEFMNLGNIHAIRKSFHAVRQLCASSPDDPNWFGQLEKTMWMQHLSGLLGAAMTVVHTIEKNGRPVLVHCSDGWDRTPQIVATAQLCLDPYYRTVEGFRVLVEREWLNFGHKFADRSGNGPHSDEVNERCPVFLQWLDLVHQIQRQYPCSFEFSGSYLVSCIPPLFSRETLSHRAFELQIKMAQHSLSCLFGTFLCNSLKERLDNSVFERTFSVWPFLAETMYRNPLYKHETEKVLWPAHSVRFLHFWSDVYLGSLGNKNGIDLPLLSNERQTAHHGTLTKTRSTENLTTNELGQSTISRRSSDPNMAVESINSMFDIRSKADKPVDDEEEHEEASKELELDVTDATNNGRNCLDHDDEDEDEDDDDGVAESHHRPNDQNKDTSDTGQALWCGPSTATVATATAIQGHGTENNCSSSSSSNSCSRNHKTTTPPDPESAAPSGKISLSYNILPRVHVKHTPARMFPHHLDLHVPMSRGRQLNLSNAIAIATNGSPAAPPNGSNADDSHSMTPEPQRTPSTGGRVRRNTYGASAREKNSTENGSPHPYSSSGLISLPPTPQGNQDRTQFSIPCPDGLAHGLNEQNIRLHQIVQEHKENGSDIIENASTCSWEAVEERSGPPSFVPALSQEKKASSVLWVPDHAVSRCSSCQTEFWLGRRKHHCRSCGEIFCADCSEFWAPLPYEKLFNPVRLCGSCYTTVTS